MDIRGLRNLNLIGTILFCIIGIALVSTQYIQYIELRQAQGHIEDMMGPDSGNSNDSEFDIFIGILIVWFLTIIIFTILLYNFTVRGLDQGNYSVAKTWTIIGIVVGFAGGIIPLIIFIVSYVSFDDAIRTTQYSQIYHGYPPYPVPIRYCLRCKRQIPADSRLCPYCGVNHGGKVHNQKKVSSPKLKKYTPGQNQNRKPLPHTPKR